MDIEGAGEGSGRYVLVDGTFFDGEKCGGARQPKAAGMDDGRLLAWMTGGCWRGWREKGE